ncbi:molybdopterin-binding protein [Desulfohalovibrio reitneri]|uniref:molybdopterin-binding protein n=1 Tax=Desulfohalovibrio reitneri TaxID=1307759 RepID=UPI0004A6CF84
MRRIPVEDAVGSVLCHDITEIIPGQRKGRAFKKGHVVSGEDVERLLHLGKEHLYVLNLENGLLHENEAAGRIAGAVAGKGLEPTEPSEGRINLQAQYHGLLQIDVDRLDRVNSIENVVLATVHTGQEVAPGRPVAGTRIVPLVIQEEAIRAVEDICAHGPLIEVLPFRQLRVGMVTTGSEIYKGRIKDKFGPVVRDKFERLGCSLTRQVLVSDDIAMTVSAIENLIAEGADMVVVTGGMSVDPDDLSPSAIGMAGGEVVSYGSPTFPGAMFMLAYKGEVPLVGLPGCVMYHQTSIFDLIIPRLVAGAPVTRRDIVRLGHGGFCAGCSPCRYPVCPFGKR